MIRTNKLGACCVVLIAGCTMGDDGRTSVETNELGVATVAVSKHSEGRERLVEVRGFDDDGDEIAAVRWKVGTIDDMLQWLPDIEDGEHGSEITFSVAGTVTRMLTRETDELLLEMPDHKATAVFVGLQEVSSALAASSMRFDASAQAAPTTEAPYTATACASSTLMTTPTAKQCCYGMTSPTGTARFTHFINPNNALVKRRQNFPNLTACKASDGVSACSGTACYYGPNGFARPVLTVPPPGYPYWYIAKELNAHETDYYCLPESSASNLGQFFPDRVGTFPTGQGCPGGGSSAGEWDY